MKKLFICIVLLACTGCEIVGPYTGTKYSIGVDSDNGLYLHAKPLAFDKVKSLLD
jgi:hypothetical protein